MVNLPPEQPTPTPEPDSRRRDQILDFDELLALVLAFIGIGSILWWGLGRSPELMAGVSGLQRRVTERSAIVPLDDDQQGELESEGFEGDRNGADDRRFRSEVAEEEPNGSSDFDENRRSNQRSEGSVRGEAVPVPMAPATVPSGPADEADGTTQPIDISDVPPSHWAYPFIKPMFEQGYLPDLPESGFQPDQTLTRAELAALLTQAFGSAPREGSVRTFNDVPSDYWAASAIDNAVAQGFMNGYPEGDFRPEQAVPRYEVIVSLATGLDLKPPSNPDSTLQAFVDLDGLPDWARPKVAAAAENSLVVDYPNPDQLQPAKAATRAEIVAMIHQALVQRGKLPAVESKYVVP